MKYSFLILIVLTINSTLFAQGILKTVPEKPHPGDVVKFTYTPPEELANEELPLTCVVYRLGDYKELISEFRWNGKPFEMQLKRKGGAYTSEIPTTPEMVGLIFSFTWGEVTFETVGRTTKLASGKMDNNDEKGFFTPLFTNDNKPCPTAYSRMADHLSSSFKNKMAYANPLLAREYYLTEMEYFPENTSVLAMMIAGTFDREKDSSEIQIFGKKYLETIFGNGPESDADYMATISLFGLLGLKNAAKYFSKISGPDNVGGFFMYQKLFDETYEETDVAKMKILLDSTITCYYNMDYYMRSTATLAGGMLPGLIADYLIKVYNHDNNNFEEALDNYNWNLTGGLFELNLYKQLIDSKIEAGNYDVALHLNGTLYTIAHQRFKQLHANPEAYERLGAGEEYSTKQSLKNNYSGIILDCLTNEASIYLEEGDCEKALSKMDEITEYLVSPGAQEANLARTASFTLDPLAADIYVKCKPLDEAIKYMEQIIAKGTYGNQMVELLKELYVKKNGSEEGFMEYQKGLREADELELQAKLKETEVNETAPDFNLVDNKGNSVKLSDLKGKTVFLDFWATWCGPCKGSFPAMQQLLDYYKSNPDVVFLFIDTFESGAKGDLSVMRENSKKLMEEENYSFHVVFDTKSEVAASYKVTAIPTKIVIDKNGTMRYKAVGGGYFSNLVDEVMAMIESVK